MIDHGNWKIVLKDYIRENFNMFQGRFLLSKKDRRNIQKARKYKLIIQEFETSSRRLYFTTIHIRDHPQSER